MFTHARPGTSDTSAISTDQVNNPGTMNAIINFASARLSRRGRHQVAQGRSVPREQAGDEVLVRARPRRQVLAASARAGDGAPHPQGRRGLDRRARGDPARVLQHRLVRRAVLGQPPDRPAPGRPAGSATSARRRSTSASAGATARTSARSRIASPTSPPSCSRRRRTRPISAARANAAEGQGRRRRRYTHDRPDRRSRPEFGQDAVARGREVFAANCARCHSSIPEAQGGAFTNRDFRALDDKTGGPRATGSATTRRRWRPRSAPSAAARCTRITWRATSGRSTARRRCARAAPDPNIREPHDGGRGYYRNVSLLSVWAHAPFMHNNAIGPELCGKPQNRDNDFYRSPLRRRGRGKLAAADKAPACWAYDPSVEGRFKLYDASMDDLLNPDARASPSSRSSTTTCRSRSACARWDGKEKQVVGLTIVRAEGRQRRAASATSSTRSSSAISSRSSSSPTRSTRSSRSSSARTRPRRSPTDLRAVALELMRSPEKLVETLRKHPKLLEAYTSCGAEIENDGPPLRRGSARGRQEGADRFPRDAVTDARS